MLLHPPVDQRAVLRFCIFDEPRRRAVSQHSVRGRHPAVWQSDSQPTTTWTIASCRELTSPTHLNGVHSLEGKSHRGCQRVVRVKYQKQVWQDAPGYRNSTSAPGQCCSGSCHESSCAKRIQDLHLFKLAGEHPAHHYHY